MRIALVAPFGLRAKGTTRARVLPVGRALARRGHRVAVFIPPYDSPKDSGRRWEEDSLDVINMALPGSGVVGGVLWHFRLAWRLFRAVRDWRPDIVHVFKPKGPSGLVGAALWWWPRRIRDQAPGTRDHLSSSVVVVDADDWEGPGGWNDDLRAAYSPLQRRFFAWQERYLLSHADAWTVTSACLRDRAVAFGADPERIFVLHNGIDEPSDQPSLAGARTKAAISHPWPEPGRRQPSVLLYTRFAGVRVPDVVGIWERVLTAVPEARLAVVGRGLAGEEVVLADMPGVEVVGWLEAGDLPAFFGRMDVAVVPWADTPSNRARHSAKVLELMAAELPIVAYAVGELPATLGDAGVLVPPGDEAAFARSVVALLGDRERAQRLGAIAGERALAQFSWERLANVALAAYTAAGAAA